MFPVSMNLNNGARGYSNSSLGAVRKQILERANNHGQVEDEFANLENLVNEYDEEQAGGPDEEQRRMASYLQVLAEQSQGRRVPMLESPAQRQGYMPQNPSFFGMQIKNPIPYHKIVTDANNLSSVMRGYQEVRKTNGMIPDDAGNIIANTLRAQTLVSQAFNKQQNESIYNGVPKSSAANLFRINAKNQRENSIYNRLY